MDIYSKLRNLSTASWAPPVPDAQLDETSERLPVSSRIHPEYLVALFALFESEHHITPKSLSHLLQLAVQEACLKNWDVIQKLPPAQFSVDFLIERGFMSVTQENKLAIGRIGEKEEYMQEALQRIGDDPFQLYKFWQSRDPDKAETYLLELDRRMRDVIGKEPADHSSHISPSEETVLNLESYLSPSETSEPAPQAPIDRGAILTPDMIGVANTEDS